MSPYRESAEREQETEPKPSLLSRIDAWHERAWKSDTLARWFWTCMCAVGIMLLFLMVALLTCGVVQQMAVTFR